MCVVSCGTASLLGENAGSVVSDDLFPLVTQYLSVLCVLAWVSGAVLGGTDRAIPLENFLP